MSVFSVNYADLREVFVLADSFRVDRPEFAQYVLHFPGRPNYNVGFATCLKKGYRALAWKSMTGWKFPVVPRTKEEPFAHKVGDVLMVMRAGPGIVMEQGRADNNGEHCYGLKFPDGEVSWAPEGQLAAPSLTPLPVVFYGRQVGGRVSTWAAKGGEWEHRSLTTSEWAALRSANGRKFTLQSC